MNIQHLCTLAALTAIPCLVQPAMANKVSKEQVAEKLTIVYNSLNEYYKIAKQFENREVTSHGAAERINAVSHKSGVAFIYLQQYEKAQPGIVKQMAATIANRKQAIANYHAACKIYQALHREGHHELNRSTYQYAIHFRLCEELAN